MSMEYNKDLEDLMEELRGEKLEIEPPKTVFEPEPEGGEEQVDVEAEEIEAEEAEEDFIKDFKGLPELIVGVLDIFLSNIASAWTKTDRQRYKLDEDERRQLTKAWDTYLKNQAEIKMKPETILMFTTLVIYAPKLITVMDDRKAYKRRCLTTQEAE